MGRWKRLRYRERTYGNLSAVSLRGVRSAAAVLNAPHGAGSSRVGVAIVRLDLVDALAGFCAQLDH